MRISVSWAVLIAVLCLGVQSKAQLGFGSSATVLENATVYVDGKPIENCRIVYSGKRIKAIGPDAEIPEGADRVDMKGAHITPVLIDASSTIGLSDAGAGASKTRGRPHFDVLDRIDPFDGDPFGDVLEQGVAYVYVRNPINKGIGGRGAGLLVPSEDLVDPSTMKIEEVEALHANVSSGSGPIARYLEVKGFEKQVESAEKYKESWKKYREALKKYEEELEKLPADKSKKKNDKKSSKKSDAKKKPDEKKSGKKDKKSVGADLGEELYTVGDDCEACESGEHCGNCEDCLDSHDCDDPDHDHDDCDDPSHDHGSEEEDGPADAATIPEPSPWNIWELGEPDRHPVRVVRAAREATKNHDPHYPTRWDIGSAELSPRPSFVDDTGTEPHLAPEARPARTDFAALDIFVCPHCGTELEGQQHFHPEPEGFDFWEFAVVDEKKPSSKPTSSAKGKDDKTKSDKGPKKPKEPAFDPTKEQLVRVIKGELPIRIEVHRAADIRNVLEVIERHPMRVVLEGVTEGWMVAEDIAKAEVPVIVYGDMLPPKQEGSTASGPDPFANIPVEFLRFLPQLRRPRSNAPSPEGRAVPDLAARLSAAGVPVVISASRKADEAAHQLLLAAAGAAGAGMDRAEAMKAVTTRPAQILGLSDSIGELEKGKRASFVVFDGDPFSSSSAVRAIYVDGKTHYEKK